MHTLSHTHTARVHKETFEGNGYVYYLDCGDGTTCVCIVQTHQIVYIIHVQSFWCIIMPQ